MQSTTQGTVGKDRMTKEFQIANQLKDRDFRTFSTSCQIFCCAFGACKVGGGGGTPPPGQYATPVITLIYSKRGRAKGKDTFKQHSTNL